VVVNQDCVTWGRETWWLEKGPFILQWQGMIRHSPTMYCRWDKVVNHSRWCLQVISNF
jgi:hypothetical protein